jgi:hypothetical protein
MHSKRAIANPKRASKVVVTVVELRPEISGHGRQRRPPWELRGWLTPREYAEATGDALRTVQHWCANPAEKPRLPTLPRSGKESDYKIPVDTLYRLNPRLKPDE